MMNNMNTLSRLQHWKISMNSVIPCQRILSGWRNISTFGIDSKNQQMPKQIARR
jgi:hypothetical protein